MFLALLTIIAVVARGQDLRRRDPIRRFGRQQTRRRMARAASMCEKMEAGLPRRGSRPDEHGNHFYSG
jgi:hypothetical protein